jgi:hypothetical protein
MPTNGVYSNWNWEDQSLDNWKRAESESNSGWVRINPPFLSETPAFGDMNDVFERKDYTKAKGWRLVWAQFGPSDMPYPYFVLYNKYRGLLRTFFYLEDRDAYTHTVVTCGFHSTSRKPGVLTYGGEYAIAPDEYLKNPTLGNDLITVVIPRQGIGQWGVADFPIFLDPNIYNLVFQGANMTLSFYGCDVYDAYVSGSLNKTPDEDQSRQHTIIGNIADMDNTSNNEIKMLNSKLFKQFKTNDDLQKCINLSTSGINANSPSFLTHFKNEVEGAKVKFIKDGIDALTKDPSWEFNAFVKLFKLIVGVFPSEESAGGTASSYKYVTLGGDITLKKTLGGGTFKIPGVQAVSGSRLPYYDCPIGIINLETTPTIKVTKPYGRMSLCSGITGFTGNQIYLSGYKGKFVKYKLDEDIKLVMNNLPGYTIESVKFAILCKPNGTGDYKYNIDQPTIARYRYVYSLNGQTVDCDLPNTVYNDLSIGRFEIVKYGDEIIYGTPYVDKNQLKGVTFEVPEYTDISLGVFVVLRNPAIKDPIFFKGQFLMHTTLVDPLRPLMANFDEQPTFPYSDYYQCAMNYTLSLPNNSSVYKAVGITLNPGFSGVAGFQAGAAADPYPYLGNTIIRNPLFSCDETATIKPRLPIDDGRELAKNRTLHEVSFDQVNIFPNPTTGLVSIQTGNTIVQSIIVTDMLGCVCYEKSAVSSSDFEVDLSNKSKGLYLFHVTTDCGVKTIKVLLY